MRFGAGHNHGNKRTSDRAELERKLAEAKAMPFGPERNAEVKRARRRLERLDLRSERIC